MAVRLLIAVVLAGAALGAAAQQLYRWTDERGRTHVTDTPPPPGAKIVRRIKPGAGGAAQAEGPAPYVLQRAMQDYPVTLYTAPSCQDPCAKARDHLNRRGVPFKEVQVWEEQGAAELKKLTGVMEVPALKVGASTYTGFHAGAYDGMLDTAGYPRAGILPARSQAAPAVPDGYNAPDPPPTPQPVKPEPETPVVGPYSPGARGPQRARP